MQNSESQILPNNNPPTISLARKVLYSFVALVLFFLLFETALRVFDVEPAFANHLFVFNRNLDYPEVFRRDQHLFWRLRGPQTIESKFFESGSYQINELGLRVTDFDSENSAPIIVALGNSCTFGWQVSEDSCYIQLLVQGLANSGKQYQALNAGIPGYSSFQGKKFFASDIAAYKPAVVLIAYGWNDQWPAANDVPDEKQKMADSRLLDLQDSVNRLRSYRALRSLILGASESSPDSLLSGVNRQRRVSPQKFSENLFDICRQVKDAGGIPVLLSSPIPDIRTYYGPGHFSPLHNRHELYNLEIRRLAFDQNISLVDLAAEFDRYDDLFSDASKDPIHYNAKGHALAAELIFSELEFIWNQSEGKKLHSADGSTVD